MPELLGFLQSFRSEVGTLKDSMSTLKDSMKNTKSSMSTLEDSVATMQHHASQSTSQPRNAATQAPSQELNGEVQRGDARLDIDAIKWSAKQPFASHYSREIYEDLYGAFITAIQS